MRAGLVLALGCALWSGLTLAQNVGNGPNYQTPSAPNYKPPTVPPAPTYKLPPLPEPSEAQPATGGAQLFVKRIEVQGATAIRPAAIATLTAPYLNRMVSSGELQSLRIALTHLYVDKGYINSGVILPDQQVKDGVVVFRAIEGKLTRIVVSGKSKLRPRYVASRIRAHVPEPLRIADLQYALRSLQQNPNVLRLDAALQPGDSLGQGVLHLNVEEQPRFSAGLSFDNHQSSSIGADIGTATFGARDLTGYGDEFRGSIGYSHGNTLGSGIFTMPVTAHDAFVQAYYSRADAAIIEQPFRSLNIKEFTRTYGLLYTMPIIDRIENRLVWFAGIESGRQFTELLGAPFSFSPGAQNGVAAVAIALGGLDWTRHGTSSVTDLRVTYRRGVDALGATIDSANSTALPFNPNPTGADGRFGLEQLQFIHVVRLNGISPWAHLNDRAQLIMRASGQFSQQPLLSLEKFTVGGVNTVRGDPENLLVRDDGVAATLELQLPLAGYQPVANPRDLVFAPFLDYGRSWDKVNANPGNPLLNSTDPDSIASAGLGLLWNPLRGLDAQIYWGRNIATEFHNDDPLHYVPHDLQYHGIHFAVAYVARW
ncbi:MAG TPA: POTRA domain-containing protein [Steroidobacteraceae bacterium]